jgi:hypothetical protein
MRMTVTTRVHLGVDPHRGWWWKEDRDTDDEARGPFASRELCEADAAKVYPREDWGMQFEY